MSNKECNRYKYTGKTPENKEPDIQKLLSNYITPTNHVYDRNHSEYPDSLDPERHVVHISGLLPQPIAVSIAQLRSLPQHSVLCCLQCAGNRRHTMRTKMREVNGIDWFDGAVANCSWKGPRLRDVLELAGVDQMSHLKGEKGWKGHVECLSHTLPCEDTEVYGGSITLERAMMEEGDCILALDMNGRPLNVKHGAPIRAVFPGILGARSVKWLTHINVQLQESSNHYQQRDYKVLPAAAVNTKAAEKYWDLTPAMNDMPVNSIIGVPSSGSFAALDNDGTILVKGYALPAGMDGPVVRVEVSSDGGNSWVNADLDFGGRERPGLDTAEGRRNVRWAWCLWTARVRVAQGTSRRLLSRATDARGNSQPKEGRWTLRGVGYNAWGEVDDLTIVSGEKLPGAISIGDGLEAPVST